MAPIEDYPPAGGVKKTFRFLQLAKPPLIDNLSMVSTAFLLFVHHFKILS